MDEEKSDSEKNQQKRKAWLALFMVLIIGLFACGLTGCENKTVEASAKPSSTGDVGLQGKQPQLMESVKKQRKLIDTSFKSLEEIGQQIEKIAGDTEQTAAPAATDPVKDTNTEQKKTDVPTQEGNVGTQVPQDANNYFADALFIGDSRMQGFMLYSGVKATGYTESGLSVSTVMTKPFVRYNGSRITVPQALSMNQFGKIYICLGMNELGWIDTDRFINEYGEVIDQIKDLQPNATITIEALLPVTAEKSSQGSTVNNDRIAQYNGLIQKLASDKGVGFLNAAPAVSDESGALKGDATTDGVHLNKRYCQLWYQYLLDNK